MSLEIRPFLNTDVSDLERVRRAHWESMGFSVDQQLSQFRVSATQFWDDYVLAKCYFDVDLFWVAELDGRVVGFVHSTDLTALHDPELDLSQIKVEGKLEEGEFEEKAAERVLLIDAFRIDSNALAASAVTAESIAGQMLRRLEERAIQLGFTKTLGFGSLTHFAHYLGIEPGFGMIGVSDRDTVVKKTFEESGYRPSRHFDLFELVLGNFRPTMDRQQLMLKRQYAVRKSMAVKQLEWTEANALSHAEEILFEMFEIRTRQPFHDLVAWRVAGPIANVMHGDWHIFFDHINAVANASGGDALAIARCLVSEVASQLQADNANRLHLVVPSDRTDFVELVQRIGFRKTETGVQYEKRLTAMN
jgi:GNAT superfamily N-acetyltransferase